ncbi:hydroxymethylglutaryl-CoA lyase [bacterium]|nr:hydroxymethylglutaryl-CoA lyase [bacterium]
MALPKRVTVVEVGPRDGLQNEKTPVSTADKVRFIDCLSATGLSHIEVTSFVNPAWIPPLADAVEVASLIQRRPGVTYTGLVPNLKGYQRAKEAGLDAIALFMSATETHSKKNINKSIDEALSVLSEVATAAREDGVAVRAYLSVVFGCPYEGKVDPAAVVRIVNALLEMGVYQISLGDTTGMANPVQVRALLERLSREVSLDRFALHFHDTRGTALANVMAGLEMGITTFDASAGGLGGCPYAPGASGNLATDDLVYVLHEMGIETGIDLDKLLDCSAMMQRVLGKELPSRYLKSRLAACAV